MSLEAGGGLVANVGSDQDSGGRQGRLQGACQASSVVGQAADAWECCGAGSATR